MEADLIVCGARVITMDAGRPRAEAVAVKGGRIVAVGSDAAVLTLRGKGTRVVEAGGRTLLPGFVESHMHLFGGAELNHLQLTGLHGFEALAAAFRAEAARKPGFLMAEGADYGLLPGGVTRQALDRVMADRPIAIRAMDHHTVWANTLALEQAGLLHGAAMPPGHEVVMGADGLATGELREFEAFDPILALAGVSRMYLAISKGTEPATWPSDAERAVDKDHIARGLAHCAAHGCTSLVTMDGNRYTLALLRELQAEGRLTQRVKAPFHMKPEMDLSELDRASAMAAEFQDDWVSSGFVKMFMDGVVDSRTAYMVHNYPGTGARGMALFELEHFREVCTEIDRRGLQIAVHAVGDGAVRQVIDGYAAAAARNGRRDSRHRIEHIELIDRADIPRLAALGITASLQPPHAPGVMDFPFLPTMDEVIGRDRWGDAYLWRTLKEAGAPVAFASDWPITDVSILRAIQSALARTPWEGGRDERFSLIELLHGYTAGGAWAARLDHVTGTLRVGMAGDLVLLGGDIEAVPSDRIAELGIALTVAGGRITHQGAGIA